MPKASTAAVAICEWLWRVSAAHKFEKLIADERPAACRASIGERIVTVWLPQGAVIRLRIDRWSRNATGNAFDQTYSHRYGRDRDNKIVIRLCNLPEAA